jgi:hypothetical protein
MSVSVVGMWELAYFVPLEEEYLWEFMLTDFGVDDYWMHPITGINRNFVKEKATLPEIFLENSDKTIGWVDERGTTDLKDYTHPNNALYVFGKANYDLWTLHKEPEHESVKISTSANLAYLWPHQACSIVLYDRLVKG